MEEDWIPSKEEIETLKKAGQTHKQLIEYAKSIISPGRPLIEIANLIDDKIESLGAKPAFPVNLSINEIAAHATPAHNSEEKAHGLLKVDIGVHLDGLIADGAITIDLENDPDHKKLIDAAQAGLSNALETISTESEIQEIGQAVESGIKSNDCIPIQNLSGHSIDPYDLHSGITIPNINNHSDLELPPGLYAIEPFATLPSGSGAVKDGKPSGIYHLQSEGSVRDPFAREVLQYIKETYQGLPFCSRWLVKKFGPRAILSLKRLEDQGLLHHYAQLVERSGKPVAQAEHTVLVLDDQKIITTK